ncbi:MAG: BrnT family toxin [Candidatus Thiodiazotropha sp.]
MKKHGISFEETKSVFYDEFAVQFYDSENSELEEDRFLMLGLSSESRILIVCHCERDSGNTIRIISARKATSRERIYYAGDSS